jgi:5-methylcytosine-specific restriction endonuclease McrBC GTP-binding regulatory subunit McrB
MQLRITGWRIIPVLKHLTDANISNATYDINLLFYLGENNTFYLDLNLINPPGLYNVESGKEEKREGEHRSEEGSLLNEVTGKNSESNLEDNAYIYLQDLDLAENLKGSNIDLKKIRTALRIKKQIILMGPPGTSKSHLAIQIALIETKNIEQVQFHPAYAYEDFVECREPTGESFLKFEPQPRIFRNLCQRALKSKDDTFVLIIDEINRGNVERIFGELIFGLEYRDQRIRTLYFKEGLQIPSNLLIIGTMNTVDLSITNIDAALRRRFYIIELHPDPQILINYWSKHLQDQYPEFQSIIVNFMSELNILISEEPLIGPYRTIGHTIFMLKSISENISIEELWGLLELEWEYTIRPTLLEYLNFEAKKLKIIIEKINKKVTVENEMQQSVGIITYLEEINKKSA